MYLSKFSETTGLHLSLYNLLIAEAGSNCFGKLGSTAVIPHVIYLNTHGTKCLVPVCHICILAANSYLILLILT